MKTLNHNELKCISGGAFYESVGFSVELPLSAFPAIAVLFADEGDVINVSGFNQAMADMGIDPNNYTFTFHYESYESTSY